MTTKQASAQVKNLIDTSFGELGSELTFDKIMAMDTVVKVSAEVIQKLRAQLNETKKNKPASAKAIVTTGDMGKYSVANKNISDVFPHNPMSGTLPVFNWDKPNARVPEEDFDYIPDENLIAGLIEGIAYDNITWVSGPTGCGKDAAINHVAAKLNMPVVRISFDADISRSELVGRDKLSVDKSGATFSEFIDGLLPFAMKNPCLLVLDEIDFIREDVAYVMQTVLNEGSLSILEKGGEVITIHPMCRIIATANTNGRIDEFNNHPGSREQSAAFLDRFDNWVIANYMDAETYGEVFVEYAGITNEEGKVLGEFITSYQSMYVNGDIKTPLSNRAAFAMAKKMRNYIVDGEKAMGAFRLALQSTLLNRLSTYEISKATELGKKLGIQL